MSKVDYRLLLFSIIVAILFTFIVFTSIEAFFPQPNYDDFCDSRPIKPYDQLDPQELHDYETHLDECNEEWQQARDIQSFVSFVISSLAGLISIVVALYLPVKSNFYISLANGLLLGGIITLFVGTMISWSSIATEIRPIVLVIELAIVIIVAKKKFSGRAERPKKGSKQRN